MSNTYEIPCAPQNFPITAVSFVSAAKLLVPSKMVKTSCAHSVPFLPCSKKNDDISILIKMLVFCAQGHTAQRAKIFSKVEFEFLLTLAF